MSEKTLTADDLREFRAICPFVTEILGDEPTEHDLRIVRRHIPGCTECTIKYAQFYRDGANEGTA
jgi:hypothetical protein